MNHELTLTVEHGKIVFKDGVLGINERDVIVSSRKIDKGQALQLASALSAWAYEEDKQ